MPEANVALQNAPGQNVRVLEITALQADGKTRAVVEMQVVSIADQFGNLLKIDHVVTEQEWQKQVLSELRAIRLGMQMSLIDQPDLLELARDLDSMVGDKL
jgi:hypothetical protein